MRRKAFRYSKSSSGTTRKQHMTPEEFLGKRLGIHEDLDQLNSDPSIPKLLDKYLEKAGIKGK